MHTEFLASLHARAIVVGIVGIAAVHYGICAVFACRLDNRSKRGVLAVVAAIVRVGGDSGVIERVKVQLDNGEAKTRHVRFKRCLFRCADQRGGEVDEHACLRQLA